MEKLRNQLVGIISYGFSCVSSRPGVNTRVTSYITWIVSRTTGEYNSVQERRKRILKILFIISSFSSYNAPHLKHSKLNQLQPFIDISGILKVGGRLAKAKILYDEKHPMILTANHRLTRLLIIYEHYQRLLHAGCLTVINFFVKNIGH